MGLLNLPDIFLTNFWAILALILFLGMMECWVGNLILHWLRQKRTVKSSEQLLKSAILAGIGVGWALSYALPLKPAEASGWWQIAVVFAGLPIFFYQLQQIEEETRKAQWKPEISIGLLPLHDQNGRPLSTSEIKLIKNLPTDVGGLEPIRYHQFYLVIRNEGKIAAKFVKIHLEFRQSEESGNFAPTIEFRAPRFEPVSFGKDHFLYGGEDQVIYPRDVETFRMYFHPQGARPTLAAYYFDCTVWAEGLDDPVSGTLVMRFN